MNTSALGKLAVIASTTLVACCPLTQADTISLNPIADTTLQEAFPNNNFGDGTSFQAGGRRQGGISRGLLLFNATGSIPAGATINSVTLNVSVTATPSGAFNSVFDLHRLAASWGEGNGSDHGGSPAGVNQSTWNNRFGSSGSPWTAAGGDFSATVSASRSIAGNGSYTFASTANLVSDVQAWLTNPATEFGWLINSESESTPTSIRRFGNRSSGATQPVLTINYTAVPEPGAISLLGMGMVVASFFAWRSRRAHAG